MNGRSRPGREPVIHQFAARSRILVGADTAYDTKGFGQASGNIGITPRVAQNLTRIGCNAIDGRR